MLLFLDCEYNGYQGELISMALVSEHGHEWYEVLECPNPTDWVAKNVIPLLDKAPLASIGLLSKSLEEFLAQFEHIHVIADWPDDMRYFNQVLITGPGERIDTPDLTMGILRIDAPSARPHNALADARGICQYVLNN